jgi:hypothetical protein
MNEEAYADAFLEKEIKARFKVEIEIKKMIVRRIPAGPAIWASVFMGDNKIIYVFIEGTKTMTLGDVKRIINRMGMRADRYFEPYSEIDYFDKRAEIKFKDIFPGKPIGSELDLMHYKSLVPYSPALVSILEIIDSKINQYDTDAAGGWRVAYKF